MAKIGYARVSTQDQSLDGQINKLEEYGCERIDQRCVKKNVLYHYDLEENTMELFTELDIINKKKGYYAYLVHDEYTQKPKFWKNTCEASKL